MTREEFITGYCDRSNIGEKCRRHWGVEFSDGYKQYAVPCHCGDETCHGWAMITGILLPTHFELYYWPERTTTPEGERE